MNPIGTPVEEADDERRLRGLVHVIEDDPVLLQTLVELLTLEGYACTASASASAFLQAFNPADDGPGPLCLLSDVKMPGLSGLDLQERLRPHGHMPVLLMSGDSGAQEATSAFRAGAVDFLVKPVDADQLLGAVAKALHVSAERWADRVRAAALSERVAQLTAREREVAQRVAGGQTNTDIADDLGIGLRTVKLHRHHAMLKLGAHTLADLVRIADEAGL